MIVGFHLTAKSTADAGDTSDGKSTVVFVHESSPGGADVSFVIRDAETAMAALRIADALSAAALKHLPAPEPKQEEVPA